jgi:amidohydrolase
MENIGGYGLIVVFQGAKRGNNIGIRGDMDALPLDEYLDLPYASQNDHVAHKCGHDGHVAMVAGLARYLSENKPERGNVYLIFQPAEETGEGAARMNKGLLENNIKLDYLFGLHNLPGYPKGEVVTKKDTFAAASKGMVIKLTGQTSHAAEPENGNSPVMAISKIIAELTNIHKQYTFSDLTLATVIHTLIGEIAFGTTPGYGEIRVTLRAMKDTDMQRLTKLAEELVRSTANDAQLEVEIDYTEVFPVTENSEEVFIAIKEVAKVKNLSFNKINQPFKWSEDFGQYKSITQTGFFGLGGGEDTPNLHNREYDFPDEIMPSGLNMFIGLIEHYTQNVQHKRPFQHVSDRT